MVSNNFRLGPIHGNSLKEFFGPKCIGLLLERLRLRLKCPGTFSGNIFCFAYLDRSFMRTNTVRFSFSTVFDTENSFYV